MNPGSTHRHHIFNVWGLVRLNDHLDLWHGTRSGQNEQLDAVLETLSPGLEVRIMKIVLLIARLLLGLMFTVFGLNIFLHFLPPPSLSGLAGQYFGALFQSHYILFVGAVQVIGGILLLINRYVPLALTLLGPVIVNILLFHSSMWPHGLVPPTLATIFWFILFFHLREYFAGIFTARTS
jgi:uncharacterized membrane protein YphA (DoxX/SURF4 family)